MQRTTASSLFTLLAVVLGSAATVVFLRPANEVGHSAHRRPAAGAFSSHSLHNSVHSPQSTPASTDLAQVVRKRLIAEIVALPTRANEADYGHMADLIAAYDDAERLAILRAIPDRDLRQNFLQRVALHSARENPSRTAAWLRDLDLDVDRTSALVGVARLWAQNAPRPAADFALTLPAGDDRRETLSAACAVWLEADAPSVLQWAERLDDHTDFDTVAAQIAHSPACLQADLGQSLGWAQSIHNADARQHSLGIVMQAWAERDAPAVREYLKTCPVLSSFARDTLLEDLAL